MALGSQARKGTVMNLLTLRDYATHKSENPRSEEGEIGPWLEVQNRLKKIRLATLDSEQSLTEGKRDPLICSL